MVGHNVELHSQIISQQEKLVKKKYLKNTVFIVLQLEQQQKKALC